jgi:XTP/dITP diphosphohydrolase
VTTSSDGAPHAFHDAAAGRIVLLQTSPRLPAGLLSWPAWDLLRGADEVFAPAGHPLLPYLAEPGVSVTELDAATTAAVVAETLLAAADGARVVVWLAPVEQAAHPAAADARDVADVARILGERLVTRLAQGADAAPAIELLPGGYDLPGARVLDLVAVMDRLLSPGGCPWDRAQTHASLLPYLVEETYEVVETVEAGGYDEPGPARDALVEELGDVLLQVAFHARLAADHRDAPFDLDDVAAGIVAKLVRRHPHVFDADHAELRTPEQVEEVYLRRKTAEKRRASPADGVPTAMPALAQAGKLLGRAAKAGVEVELPPSPASAPPADEAQLGRWLLALAGAAQAAGMDPEAALRAELRALRARLGGAPDNAADAGE